MRQQPVQVVCDEHGVDPTGTVSGLERRQARHHPQPR